MKHQPLKAAVGGTTLDTRASNLPRSTRDKRRKRLIREGVYRPLSPLPRLVCLCVPITPVDSERAIAAHGSRAGRRTKNEWTPVLTSALRQLAKNSNKCGWPSDVPPAVALHGWCFWESATKHQPLKAAVGGTTLDARASILPRSTCDKRRKWLFSSRRCPEGLPWALLSAAFGRAVSPSLSVDVATIGSGVRSAIKRCGTRRR